MSPRRRNAESGSHETIGSRGWFVKSGFAALGLIVVFLLQMAVRKLDRNADAISDLERRVIKLESHGHTEDPRVVRQIEKLESRVDRIERPSPWQRQPSSRR